MKKLLGISLVAALAVTPMMASAEVGVTPIDTNNTPVSISPDPTGAALTSIKAGAPYYELAKEGNHDDKAASAGYVKGAYNAAIKAVNAVHAEVEALDETYATKEGVAATVDKATGSVTLAEGHGLTVAGTPTGTIASSLSNTAVTASVTLPESVSIMNTWGSDTPATLALNNASSATTINGSVTDGTVGSTFTGTGITGGEATGTISGIDVSTAGYYDDAADATADTFTGIPAGSNS